MGTETKPDLQQALAHRFADPEDRAPDLTAPAATTLAQMAARGSCRAYQARAVDPGLIDTLCAVALSAPSKSDLQQRDIIVIDDPAVKAQLADLVAGQGWVQTAPHLLVFCGNNRRQRLVHGWREIPFENDHLDALFNAAVDAGIALSAFVTAAEAAGLGCCPISAVRNRAAAVSDLLGLPDHVFPVAGLALGYPAAPPALSMRLPLRVTCHRNRYQERNLRSAIDTYDAARQTEQPYAAQRCVDQFGTAERYGWSEDKARQYSQPERADFGAFIRAKGFNLT